MHWQIREIRWAIPALNYFIRTLKATSADITKVNSILENARDNPDDFRSRAMVNKDAVPDLEDVEGDVYRSDDDVWQVFYNWRPDEIYVVHIVRI